MRLLLGSNSTKKSASLASTASPRATEPKTRTLEAPWRAATSRISRFLSLKIFESLPRTRIGDEPARCSQDLRPHFVQDFLSKQASRRTIV